MILRCYICGFVCEQAVSLEEMIEELKKEWGDVPPEECDIVCNDCYKKEMEAPLKELGLI